ncbi:RHS repeat-associated core domain-containing protein [Vibrio campbellii]|uniref:RHS repeat-associated core domain-containing protein n=1 Tax=Vibrio campbellii TaxID=680 RepID=UPI00210B3C07|nr:RHS repeat-associated core domain-containing protein [Vibrio campbellii]
MYDRETGLYYNRHRYYDSDSGQYLSSDPIGMAGGLRPQAYVQNPLEWVDPLGLAGDPAKSTHITYMGVKDGKPYAGYASKPGFNSSADDVLKYRYGSNFDNFYVAPEPIYRGEGLEGKYTARGLEQRKFEEFGGLEGTSNKQNPV